MTRKTLFGLVLRGFPVALILAAIVLVFTGRDLGARIAQNDKNLTELTASALRLERALGYGGFIHNFKNYVLRPDERNYRAGAEFALEVALTEIGNIEALGEVAGPGYDLKPAREVLLDYGNQLAVIDDMAAGGARPGEIDQVVRIDDSEAFEALNVAIDHIHDRFLIRAEQLEADMDHLGGLFILLAITVYVSLACQLFRALYARPLAGCTEGD